MLKKELTANNELSISIVLYHNNYDQILRTVKCVLNSPVVKKLFLIDNSSTDELKNVIVDERVVYNFIGSNIGYGRAHNVAIENALKIGMKYHVIMNPDIFFSPGTLEGMHCYMEFHPEVGSIMPKVFYEDGSLQRLCKLLPTPFDLIGRRFFSGFEWAKKRNETYELHDFNYNCILNTPCLSGCFMFVRTSVLEKSGLFDKRYFMYLEDYDLTRRIHKEAKTIFYPEASVIHGHAKESYKNGKLLKIHIQSAIKYFNKWGWFFDNERKYYNTKVLNDINKSS